MKYFQGLFHPQMPEMWPGIHRFDYVKASVEDISRLASGVKAWDASLGENLELGFVGSIAHYFESPLRNVMEDEHHQKIALILRAPMKGLIDFHSRQK